MDANKIKLIITLVLALFAALYLGIAAATAQVEAIGWIGGGFVLSVCLAMGRRIWLLVPLMTGLNLTLAIPSEPTTLILAQMLMLGFGFLLFMMRKLQVRYKFTEVEFWILLFTFCVVQVYLRNPVGLNMFGGSSVGGRPYAFFALNLAVCFAFLGLRVTEKELKWILPLSIVGSILNFGIAVVGVIFPDLGRWYGVVQTTGDRQIAEAGPSGTATRAGFLGAFARDLSLWISSFISPLRACFHPVYAPLLLFSLAAGAGSGFRNIVAMVGLTYFVGVCYRGGMRSVIASSIIACVALAFVAFLNLVVPLPPNIQRSLTFLPGTWDERYKIDASGSTEWRVVMWKEALLTPNWIKNKTLGDGLGMSQRELQWMLSMQGKDVGGDAGSGKLTTQQEMMLITGGYHSGPVQTVRTIGYVGLLVLTLALIRLAVHAHRQIVRTRGSTWYPLALFIGIPIIWFPVFWIFVYGSFQGAVSILLLSGSLLRLLENNLPLPAWQPYVPQPFLLGSRHNPLPTKPA